MSISTEYPLWFIIFCILLGAGISFILYFKNTKYQIQPKLKKILFIIRFIFISFISFLLLSPLVKSEQRNIEKPVIIIAQDNSASILFNKDSVFFKKKFPEKIKKLIEELQTKFEVKTYAFGSRISNKMDYSFTDKVTDISAFFDELQLRYTNRNVGALIMATDGNYNKGKNPIYNSDFIKYPVYTIALGDTNIYKDIRISKINCNATALLGNKFPVEVIVNANKCKGSQSKLSIFKGNDLIFFKNLDFNAESNTQTIFLEIDAKQIGMQRYHATLTPIIDEPNVLNNSQDFIIEILDQKQKILILANSPHPDIAAIKESIEKSDNYSAESYLVNDFIKPLIGYNLIVMHQLPSLTNQSSAILEKIKKEKIPVIYILGSQSNYNTFNALEIGVNINVSSKTSLNEALPIINNDFSLFTINAEVKQFYEDIPPLNTVFGSYKIANSSDVLFYQKIGSVSTKQPLVLFNNNENIKNCVIAGEGIWRWKLADYMQHQKHEFFDEFITKIIQYLIVTDDKSNLRIKGNKKFYENENVEFDAELYNESYELINEPEIEIVIKNNDNKKYAFIFSKTVKTYHLNAGIFPVGEYTYEAKVKSGNKIYSKNGVFNVLGINQESLITTADHKLLFNLSRKHDGNMYYPKETEKLLKAILSRDDIKTVSYNQIQLNDMVNLLWVFILIVLLISTEWFLRKWSGNY